jgi:ketosteroid isomerase-like protein
MIDTHASASEVVREMLDLFDDGTPTVYGSEAYLELLAADCDWSERSTDPQFDGRRGNRADLLAGSRHSAERLRDRHASVDELIGDGHRVAAFWTWSAVDAATGQDLLATVVSRFTVRDGSRRLGERPG